MGFIMDFTFASAEEIRRALAARLRAQRLSQEIPQSELAQMAGISLGAVKTLERDGASSLETVIRVAQALGLADTLQSLFVLQRQSIAQMEQAELTQRQRAPRRKRS